MESISKKTSKLHPQHLASEEIQIIEKRVMGLLNISIYLINLDKFTLSKLASICRHIKLQKEGNALFKVCFVLPVGSYVPNWF
ncbi:hypothetical protein LPO01_17280 [Ligilactobacillus pobuzihii]|nr:hypothetical protein LPO01_17280 [Ligilactobacillus pobuzihii]